MSSWLGRSARFAVLAAAVVVGLATPARADRAAALRHKAAGDAAVQSGAHRRAVKAYLNAITADSTYMPAYGALSTHYLRWRQYRDAAALLARAVRKAPRYANGWYNLAYALRKLNKLNKAVLAYRRYAALRPASADPYYGIGLALKELGDHAGAAESFERYVQLEKRGERQAWVRKARVLAKSERARVKPSAAMAKKAPASKPPAAKKAATPAAPAAGAAGGTAAGAAAGAASGGAAGKSDATIKAAAVEGKSSGPVSAERRKAIAAVRAGDRAASSGRYKHALSYYRAAIAADFSYPTAYDRAGRTLFRLGDFAEAVRIFRVSIRDIPEYHLGWYNLAYALRKSKRPREAIAAYRKFAGLRPHDPDPYFGMGLAYRSLGEKAAAIRAFNRYIALEKRSKQKQWVARAEMIVKHLGGTPATPGSAAAGAVAAAAAGASAAAATPAAPTPPPKKKLTPAERRKLAAAERRRKRAEAKRKRAEAIAERRRLRKMKRAERIAALAKKRAEAKAKRAEARRQRIEARKARIAEAKARRAEAKRKRAEARRHKAEARKARIAELRRRILARRKGGSALVALPAGTPMAPPKGVEPEPDKAAPPEMPPAPEASPSTPAARLRAQGDTLARNARCLQAIALYRRALKADPFHTRAYVGIAYCGHKLKKHAVATRWLGVGLRDNPDWVDGWLLLARLWRAAGNDARAVGALHKYLEKKPGDLEARFELARAQRKAGLSGQAVHTYRDYLKREKRAKHPKRMAAFVELASIGGKPPFVGGGGASGGGAAAGAGAINLSSRKLSRAERRELARLMRSEKVRARREAARRKREARAEQRRIEREERRRKREARLAKRNEGVRSRREARAAKLAARREALRKRREAYKAKIAARRAARLAKLDARKRRREEIREQRRIEREERRRRARLGKGARRGKSRRVRGRRRGRRVAHLDARARAAARVADDLPPVQPRVRQRDVLKPAPAAARGLVEVADAQFAKGRYIVALGIYQQAVKLDPTATEPSYKAGVCAVALGRMHLAADMFERVLQQDPGNATAKVNLQMARAAAAKRKPNAAYVGGAIASARRDLSAGRYALVERKLARVVRVAKPSARLYELRAEARLGLRKAREALSDAGRALALDPSSAVALRSLGDAQRQLGKRRKAIYYYQLYLARAAQASDRAAIERVIRELEMPGGS